MARLRIIKLPLLISLLLLITGCSGSLKPGIDIIQMEGISWACNVSTSYAVFGSSAESEDKLELFLPASEGDLLYMLHDDLQVYHRYHPADGSSLTVSFDTLGAISAYLNGRLAYMELSSPASVETFLELTEAEMEQLSALYIADVLTEDFISTLRKHENQLRGLGLILENNYGTGRLQELLSIVRPRFLVMDDSWNLPDPEEHQSLSDLELLWIEGNMGALEKVVPCCSNLRSLIIADWEPVQGELLPLADLKNLRSLTIAESPLISLSSIELPATLKNLYLIACDTLSDIQALQEIKNLNSLSLAQCKRVDDTGRIRELESLQYLSLPPGTGQQEFQELTKHLNGLKAVELLDCPKIQDLSPLQDLPELRILLLQLEARQLGSLDSLDFLELVVLKSEVFDDNPQLIKDLRASLPDTKIVPGSGICLGSGWLLLLLPLILIFRHLFRRK
jgi:hypothetical protein